MTDKFFVVNNLKMKLKNRKVMWETTDRMNYDILKMCCKYSVYLFTRWII